MSNNNDSIQKTIIVAVSLCLACSIVVSGAAVLLKEKQKTNKVIDKQKNILNVAGLLKEGDDIQALYEQYVEQRVIDLASGDFVTDVDAASFDQKKAAKDPAQSITIPAGKDIASIKRRAKYASVYLIKVDEQIKYIILPMHGYGLWSTMYGFLALENDLNTVYGLSFYEHAETPGLGGEIDNPGWRAKWQGKLAFDNNNQPKLNVVKGNVVAGNPNEAYQVDGLAGATITSRGVGNLVTYWLGDQGFGPFLNKFKALRG